MPASTMTKVLASPLFTIKHAGDEDAGIADDQAAGLEDQPAIKIARRALDHGRIRVRVGRRLVVLAVGNAEPAAEIDVADDVAVGAQHAHEIRQQRERIAERIELGDLAADMHVDAGDAHAVELGGAGINVARTADRNAEFVFGFSGGDLGVGLRVDVGIDADRDIGGAALLRRRSRPGARAPASDSTLTQRMPCSTASASSRAVLPTPENMIFSRRHAGAARAQKFALGDHVGAGAEPRQRRDHGLIGIRFHRIADQRVDVGEGLREHAIMPLKRRGRIAIERRADGVRQRDQIDVFGVQHAVAISEMMHGRVFKA